MPDTLTAPIDAATVERVLLHGDLRQLTPAQKVSYYRNVCGSLGLNPLTQPFQYLVLNGREILYARREATEQLRKTHNVSLTIVAREVIHDCYVVSARATLPSGRIDESTGAVPLAGLKGEAVANALMKAETKSKRRVTLSICGLGMLDESEIDSLDSTPATAGHDVAVGSIPSGPEREEIRDDDQPLDSYDTIQAPPAPSLPRPEPPAGTVRVTRIDSHGTKNPQVTRYRITLSDGETVVTIKPALAHQAKRLCEDQTAVLVKWKETQWGKELVSFRDPTVITDADIPF